MIYSCDSPQEFFNDPLAVNTHEMTSISQNRQLHHRKHRRKAPKPVKKLSDNTLYPEPVTTVFGSDVHFETKTISDIHTVKKQHEHQSTENHSSNHHRTRVNPKRAHQKKNHKIDMSNSDDTQFPDVMQTDIAYQYLVPPEYGYEDEILEIGSHDKEHSLNIVVVNQTVSNEVEKAGENGAPVIGYAQEPLLSLTDACIPLNAILHDLDLYVNMALQETPEEPLDGLTVDESAAIRLYTFEWAPPHRSLYSMLNHTLKNCGRDELQPYFKYMKLFITALVKLPCCPPLTVWRGVTKDLSVEFPPGTPVTWWPFSSTTTDMSVLQNSMYLGTEGARTLFSVEAINGRTIKAHSHFVTEDEIVLLPGTHMIVQSQLSPATDLYIIHLKQIVPNEMLLEPPFEDAVLYPKLERPWYHKKRVVLPLCSMVIACILAAIIGGVLGSKASEIVKTYGNPFPSPLSSDTGPSPAAMVYGIFDVNPSIDLAVLNLGDRTIDILLNDGQGNFPKVPTSETSATPIYASLCYTTDDGAYVNVLNRVDQSVSVILVSPDGTLATLAEYPGGSDPVVCSCADFNNDSIIDIAIASLSDGSLALWLSGNKQAFAEGYIHFVGWRLYDMRCDDFNKDGIPDMAIADYFASTIIVLYNLGSDIHYLSRNHVNENPIALIQGDFNNDKNLDLAVIYSSNMNLTLLFGFGNGSFKAPVHYNITFIPIEITAGDLNSDGSLDLILCEPRGYIYTLYGSHNGTFQSLRKYLAGKNSSNLVACDFNNDNAPDVAVTNLDEDTVSVFINRGNGELEPQVKYAVGSQPLPILASNLTNDAYPDLLVVNYADDTAMLLKGNGDGTFQARIPFLLDAKSGYIASGDINRDNRTDLVITDDLSGSVSVLLIVRDYTFQRFATYKTGSLPNSVALHDFNGDGILDIVVLNQNDNNLALLLGYGNGSFQNASHFPTGIRPAALAIDDFNNDTHADIAVASIGNQSINVLLGYGNGTFRSHDVLKIEKGPVALISVDLNNDGFSELVVANGDENTFSVFVGRGDGTFNEGVKFNTTRNPKILLYSDFNRDYIWDLAVISGRADELHILLSSGNMSFPFEIIMNTPTFPSAGLCHDLNSDGRIDMAITSKKRSSLSVFLNGQDQIQMKLNN